MSNIISRTGLTLLPTGYRDSVKASLLVKARRLVALSKSSAEAPAYVLYFKARRLVNPANPSVVIPGYVQRRVFQGQPLPRVEVARVAAWKTSINAEKTRKFRRMLAFVAGMEGGPQGQGIPRDVFRVVLSMLTLPWDPLWNRNGAVWLVHE